MNLLRAIISSTSGAGLVMRYRLNGAWNEVLIDTKVYDPERGASIPGFIGRQNNPIFIIGPINFNTGDMVEIDTSNLTKISGFDMGGNLMDPTLLQNSNLEFYIDTGGVAIETSFGYSVGDNGDFYELRFYLE